MDTLLNSYSLTSINYFYDKRDYGDFNQKFGIISITTTPKNKNCKVFVTRPIFLLLPSPSSLKSCYELRIIGMHKLTSISFRTGKSIKDLQDSYWLPLIEGRLFNAPFTTNISDMSNMFTPSYFRVIQFRIISNEPLPDVRLCLSLSSGDYYELLKKYSNSFSKTDRMLLDLDAIFSEIIATNNPLVFLLAQEILTTPYTNSISSLDKYLTSLLSESRSTFNINKNSKLIKFLNRSYHIRENIPVSEVLTGNISGIHRLFSIYKIEHVNRTDILNLHKLCVLMLKFHNYNPMLLSSSLNETQSRKILLSNYQQKTNNTTSKTNTVTRYRYLPPLIAENGSYYGEISKRTGRPKTIYVHGYFRSDGTYVRGHYRSKPRR